MTLGLDFSPTLDPSSFRAIADLAYRESGLILAEDKNSMICSRLRNRLRELKLNDFADYTNFLQSAEGANERHHLISALTTNVSHFFREAHHFETLRDVFRSRLDDLRDGAQMRIWSAGCSNGQEAISAAITLCEAAPGVSDLDVRILGTDIDTKVIQFARTGAYSEGLMRGISPEFTQKYFDETSQSTERVFSPKEKIRKMIRFNPLNLLGPWPMRKHFDIIFCRNVVIYFDVETQVKLWPRMKETLSERGTLFLGHSERIADPHAFGFSCTGPTTYRMSAS